MESERVMLGLRLREGIAKKSLSSESVNRLLPFLFNSELDGAAWGSGRVVLTLIGRLVADRIVREILL